jgi:adenosylmethionine-8-amino-7-oxononanoate aminotransferase
VQKAAETGAYLDEKLEALHKYPIVGDVRGMGMLQAVELLQEREGYKPLEPVGRVGSWIRDRCYELGMILRNNSDILVLAPSLTITCDQADEMVGATAQAIAGACKHFGYSWHAAAQSTRTCLPGARPLQYTIHYRARRTRSQDHGLS